MFGFGTKIESININEINGVIKTTTIDIRNKNEVLRGHIKGTKNVPMETLLANPDKYLTGDKKYYIMCQSGMRSKSTVKKLTKQGFNVVNLKGGFLGYRG